MYVYHFWWRHTWEDRRTAAHAVMHVTGTAEDAGVTLSLCVHWAAPFSLPGDKLKRCGKPSSKSIQTWKCYKVRLPNYNIQTLV